jgi:transcriptional regulator with XRE-family HTH domain
MSALGIDKADSHGIIASVKTKRLDHHRLYDLRLQAGKSQADVAHELRNRGFKADATAISRWERGLHEPGASVMPSLAEIFGVATDDLYSDDDEESSVRSRSLASDLQLAARLAGILERRPELIDAILAAEETV